MDECHLLDLQRLGDIVEDFLFDPVDCITGCTYASEAAFLIEQLDINRNLPGQEKAD